MRAVICSVRGADLLCHHAAGSSPVPGDGEANEGLTSQTLSMNCRFEHRCGSSRLSRNCWYPEMSDTRVSMPAYMACSVVTQKPERASRRIQSNGIGGHSSEPIHRSSAGNKSIQIALMYVNRFGQSHQSVLPWPSEAPERDLVADPFQCRPVRFSLTGMLLCSLNEGAWMAGRYPTS